MSLSWDQRPSSDEYGSFYAPYLEALEAGHVLDILRAQRDEICTLIQSLDDEQASHRYEEGKWSVKQVLGHLVDNERIFAYRALFLARKGGGTLPGYDQEEYVEAANFDTHDLKSLEAEYRGLRRSSLQLFQGFSETMLRQTGTVDGNIMSVRAIPFIIAGHERHHMNVLSRRYGLSLPA